MRTIILLLVGLTLGAFAQNENSDPPAQFISPLPEDTQRLLFLSQQIQMAQNEIEKIRYKTCVGKVADLSECGPFDNSGRVQVIRKKSK